MKSNLYPKTQKDKAKVYLHCMVEIIARMETLNDLEGFKTRQLFAREFAHVQLRHICELIAIGCLAAQGDFETFRDFTTEYSPKKIFKSLAKINPNFFPTPSKRVTKDGHHHLAANRIPGAATQDDIVEIWSKSGGHLHRASLNNYLKKTFNPLPESSEIEDAHVAIALLLHSHLIPIRLGPEDPKITLLEVHLDDGEGKIIADFLYINTDDSTVSVETFRAEDVSDLSERRIGL